MRKHWGASPGYGALIVAIGLDLLVFCGTTPTVAAAISGFLLDGPLMSAGLCEMSRLFSGLPASFDDLGGIREEMRPPCSSSGSSWRLAPPCGSVSRHTGHGSFTSRRRISARPCTRLSDSTNRSQVLAYVAIGGILATGVFLRFRRGYPPHHRPARHRRAGDACEPPTVLLEHSGDDSMERIDTGADHRPLCAPARRPAHHCVALGHATLGMPTRTWSTSAHARFGRGTRNAIRNVRGFRACGECG